MRAVYFRALLRLALHITRPRQPVGVAPPITVDPNAPWAYSIDGLEIHGWRTFDWTALVPAHDLDSPRVS